MICEKTRRRLHYAQLKKTAQARNQVDKKIRRLHISILNFMFHLLFLQARCGEHQALWLCVVYFHRSEKTLSSPRNDMCFRCFAWVVSPRSFTCSSSVTNIIFFCIFVNMWKDSVSELIYRLLRVFVSHSYFYGTFLEVYKESDMPATGSFQYSNVQSSSPI